MRAFTLGLLAVTTFFATAHAEPPKPDIAVSYAIADPVENLCLVLLLGKGVHTERGAHLKLYDTDYYVVAGTIPCTESMKKKAVATFQ